MSVVFQVLRDATPVLTLLAITATLRGQRVINANAAREKLSEARNEALMVIFSPQHPSFTAHGRDMTNALVVSLVLEVLGPSPIVQLETALVEPNEQGIETLQPATLKSFSVLKPGTEHALMTIQSSSAVDGVFWRVTWEDRHGYVWTNRYSFGDGRMSGVELVQSPTGQSPITNPTRGQRIRNKLWPSDNWDPRRVPGQTDLTSSKTVVSWPLG